MPQCVTAKRSFLNIVLSKHSIVNTKNFVDNTLVGDKSDVFSYRFVVNVEV